MTTKTYSEDRLRVEPGIRIGPRLAHDIRRRVRELQARLPGAMSGMDRAELAKLRALLNGADPGDTAYD
jgi:hypothetical protein